MVKMKFNVVVSTLFTFFLFSTLAFAESKLSDNIILNTPEYKTRKESLVTFSHKKHSSSDGYGIACGECHHNDKGEPLDLKIGDTVNKCIDCHSDTGKKSKEEQISKREEIKKYHKKALHTNCRSCHSKFNKKHGLKKGDPGVAPTTCKSCHPKK